jgi:hypothetical protein
LKQKLSSECCNSRYRDKAVFTSGKNLDNSKLNGHPDSY